MPSLDHVPYVTADYVGRALDMALHHNEHGDGELKRGNHQSAHAMFAAGAAWAALAQAGQSALNAKNRAEREQACPACRGTRRVSVERRDCCGRHLPHRHPEPCTNPVHA
ncbi:hypothetical protein ACFWNL_18270 [Kitasatospora sp. NPDC058397]|uniref:hypothetical protein n=1 Tax=unclassified Kitasatospora TaxID=2633591 RepID=UPI00364F9610